MNNWMVFARRHWVDALLMPPFLLAICHFLYGSVYFSSVSNFVLISLPWLAGAVLCPAGCHWVRNTMLQRFPQFDDWGRRIVWSVAGYLIVSVGFSTLAYFGLQFTHYAEASLSSQKYFTLILLTVMCVLIGSTIYEGVTYFDKLKNALHETGQLEKLHLETQFQGLQNQLNPHFLFNSLNVLSSLITENPRRAEDFVDELSNVYRYLLRSNERELASVGEELRFIRSFFHLLKTRHDSGVSLKIDVPRNLLEQKLPALALQLLVENAVKHNVISPENPLLIEIVEWTEQPETVARGKGHSWLSGSHSKTPTAKIVVRNNIQQKSARAVSNHVGLDNLRQRYVLLNVPGFEVHNDGQHFEVVLPLVVAHSSLVTA